jgi:hypothetical protein
VRNPFRRRAASAADPQRPHRFADRRDVSLSAFASGSGGRGPLENVGPVAMTNRFVETEGCAVPGCGRRRSDDIHAPEE